MKVVSPEVEAAWEKHATGIVWTAAWTPVSPVSLYAQSPTSATRPANIKPWVDEPEGEIKPLSPRIKTRRKTIEGQTAAAPVAKISGPRRPHTTESSSAQDGGATVASAHRVRLSTGTAVLTVVKKQPLPQSESPPLPPPIQVPTPTTAGLGKIPEHEDSHGHAPTSSWDRPSQVKAVLQLADGSERHGWDQAESGRSGDPHTRRAVDVSLKNGRHGTRKTIGENSRSRKVVSLQPPPGPRTRRVLSKGAERPRARMPVTTAPRSFLAHGRQGSGDSTHSTSSTATMSSSLWPASTAEDGYLGGSGGDKYGHARISISSTAYSGSALHHDERASDLDRAQRESFIDMFSPLDDQFDDALKLDVPLREETAVPKSAAKPPIPLSPKPDFSSSSLALRKPSAEARARADMVRKTRKLTQMFGQPPGAGAMPGYQSSFLDVGIGGSRSSTSGAGAGPSSPRRRHSTPDDIVLDLSPNAFGPNGAASPPASFMDLSDDESSDDGDWPSLPSPVTPADYETMAPDELRRRKREKLAKLHRFLGSRVPANMVLGVADPLSSLPPLPLPATTSSTGQSDMESSEDKRVWLRRRRSSSVAAFPPWRDEHDRVKEDLDDHEKKINVRRAQKMEKVFGVAPPQTLYHTRPGADVPPRTQSPPFFRFNRPQSISRTSSSESTSRKSRKKNDGRPSTAESNRPLLQADADDNAFHGRGRSGSLVYTHYQHSLNSLVDILDRDDRESLAELHEYLNTPTSAIPPSPTLDKRASIRSERRRSLPARTSMTSLASEFSVASLTDTPMPLSPTPGVSDFQLRRRRAAKLTAFFGVDYRELIEDVLDSIENGLEHERKRGTIDPEEAEVLLQRLREIKTKRDGIF